MRRVQKHNLCFTIEVYDPFPSRCSRYLRHTVRGRAPTLSRLRPLRREEELSFSTMTLSWLKAYSSERSTQCLVNTTHECGAYHSLTKANTSRCPAANIAAALLFPLLSITTKAVTVEVAATVITAVATKVKWMEANEAHCFRRIGSGDFSRQWLQFADEVLSGFDPKKWSPAQYRVKFRSFLENFSTHFNQIQGIALAGSSSQCDEVDASSSGSAQQHYSITVDFQHLALHDAVAAYAVLNHPRLLLPIFEEACVELQMALHQHASFALKWGRRGTVKHNVHVRINNLPAAPRICKPTIGDIRSQDVQSLVQIAGTVVRTGGVRMLEVSKQYECQNPKCRFRFTVKADPEQGNMLPQPRTCPNKTEIQSAPPPQQQQDAVGIKRKRCQSTNLRELEGSRVCVDYQEIKIQDHIDRLTLGKVPRTIIVILQADLVDKFNAGDDVIITGLLVRRWRPVARGVRCAVEIALEANSVLLLNRCGGGIEIASAGGADNIEPIKGSRDQLNEAASIDGQLFEDFWRRFRSKGRELDARNIIVRSVCPQLFGMFPVKLALLLALVGGNGAEFEGGIQRRSNIHMLMVGDPGCGKSQLLKFAASVTPRSVLTTGMGTTGAGLTCTAVRDGSEWSLEAGALVLSNGGVCCIDEFANIREGDRATIHESMEQQTLSVAKAGMVVKLPTKTTVIACCNPKGSYDITADLTTNTAIASPLLSRFDIVIVLLDAPNKEWDKRVSTFLLKQVVHFNDSGGKQPSQDTRKNDEGDVTHWDKATLRRFIGYVKQHRQPAMGDEARHILQRYYQLQRQSDERSNARTTVRLLESLMRLSEAHAKIMFHDEVQLMDAVAAIITISMAQATFSSSGGSIDGATHSSTSVKEEFSDTPQDQYDRQEQHVLQMLYLTRESLHRNSCTSTSLPSRQANRRFEIGGEKHYASQGFTASDGEKLSSHPWMNMYSQRSDRSSALVVARKTEEQSGDIRLRSTQQVFIDKKEGVSSENGFTSHNPFDPNNSLRDSLPISLSGQRPATQSQMTLIAQHQPIAIASKEASAERDEQRIENPFLFEADSFREQVSHWNASSSTAPLHSQRPHAVNVSRNYSQIGSIIEDDDW